MRLVYTSHAGQSWDMTDLAITTEWSGDYKQAARRLQLEVAEDDTVVPQMHPGDMLRLYEYGLELFRGYIFTIEVALGKKSRNITAYDGAIYILKSGISKNFSGITACAITRQVAADLVVPVGTMPSDAGLAISFPHLGKNAYSAIIGAWTKVSRVTNRKYLLRMQEGLLTVLEMGASYAPFIIAADTNLADADVSVSIEDAITQAVVINRDGGSLAKVHNAKDREQYGVLQAVETLEEGQDATRQAHKLLKSADYQITLNDVIGGPGAQMLMAGNAAAVNDTRLGLFGKYYILNDEHTFANGIHHVSLGLSFKAVMDEQEVSEVQSAEENADQTEENTRAVVRPQKKQNTDIWATARKYGGS